MLKEFTDNYNNLNDGAPGIDSLKKDNITKIGLDNLCLRFNIYLLTSTAPSCYKNGLTTLIPEGLTTRIPQIHRNLDP